MSYKIEEIQGIGGAFAEKLSVAHIKTTDDLLEVCRDPNGRRNLSLRTGIGEPQILKWTNMADLMRISGIGPQYAELLEASGVDTVKELRVRSRDNLLHEMQQVNTERKLTGSLPAAKVVESWIENAKTCEPAVTY